MYDDIDWMNASTDYGLISLCREMEALAAPLRAMAMPRRAAQRSRARARRRAALISASALNV